MLCRQAGGQAMPGHAREGQAAQDPQPLATARNRSILRKHRTGSTSAQSPASPPAWPHAPPGTRAAGGVGRNGLKSSRGVQHPAPASPHDSSSSTRRRPGPAPAGTHLRHVLAVALRPQARQHAAAADAVQQLVEALRDDAWRVGSGRARRMVAATAGRPAAAAACRSTTQAALACCLHASHPRR